MARKVVESIPIELFLFPANNPGLCYPVCRMVHIKEPLLLIGKEGRKEMFYLTTHSTHFIYGYMSSDIWLRIILIVRKETRCHHIGYSFRLPEGFFYMHYPTDRIAHTTAFVTPVMEHCLEREIAQWVHPMKDRSDDPSHHERPLLPQSYISLCLWDAVYKRTLAANNNPRSGSGEFSLAV